MAIVASYDWEPNTFTHHSENPARTAWPQAVAEIAEKAKAALPECNGRVEKAVAIVLNGDVELLPDGKAHVASQTDGATHYFVVNGTCECKDFPRAPQGFCKHRLAYGIYKRARALTTAQLDGIPPASVAVAPAPASTIPPHFLTAIHGKQFVHYAGLLTMAHARGLVSLKVHFVSVTAELALAEAEATFADGTTYSECADATPANVNPKVKAHFPRMALTRAKARALRDALNIHLVAVEELEN